MSPPVARRADLVALDRLPLAPGGGGGPAQHQRVAVPAARDLARRSRPRDRADRLQPVPRPGGDRACGRRWPSSTRCRPTRCSAPTARTRCSSACCSPTADPGRRAPPSSSRPTPCTPHQPADRHRGRVRGSDRGVHHRPGGAGPRAGRARRRRSSSCARRTTRPAAPNPPSWSAGPSGRAPGLVVVDEAYGQFSPWSATALRRSLVQAGDEDSRRLVVVRTFSKTWAMAAARLGYLVADPEVVDGLRAGEPALPPVGLHPGGRPPGPALPDGDGGAGGAGGRGAGPGRRRPGRAAGRDLALGRQLHPLPPEGRLGHRGVAGACSTGRCSSGTARAGRAGRLPPGDRGHARSRTTASWPHWPWPSARRTHERRDGRTGSSGRAAPRDQGDR